MNSTRLRLLARSACVGLVLLAVEAAVSQSNAPPTPPAQTTPINAIAPSDAAEKHIKRTTCLKAAKAKKLLGDQKNAFIKDCMGASPAA